MICVLVLDLAFTLSVVAKTAQIQIYACDSNLCSFLYRMDINELSHYGNQSAAKEAHGEGTRQERITSIASRQVFK